MQTVAKKRAHALGAYPRPRHAVFALVCTGLFTALQVPATEVLDRGLVQVAHHPADAGVAETCAAVIEEALREFGARLPAGEAPIRVIVAHTAEEFGQYARSFGHMRVSGLARPHQGLIIVKAPRLRGVREDFRGTLRHELVHVLLARNVNTAHLPKWLNEGLCMMLANEHYWNSLFTIARMYVQRRIIPYRDLDLSFAMPGDEREFGDAYAQALSMTRFLRDRLGEERFWQVVLATRDAAFMEAMKTHAGMNVAAFWDAYRASLWKIAVIGTVGSGSLFFIPAFLLILAVVRKRFTNRRILRRWEQEEREGDVILSWDDVSEGPHDWEIEEEERREREERW